MRRIVLALVLVAGLVLWFSPVRDTVTKRITEGGIVGPDLRPGDDGFILTTMAAAAVEAGIPLDEYAMARMIASEAGGRGRDEKIGKAWVLVNDARALGWSISKTATFRRVRAGALGTQAAGGGRYSTSKNPRTDDLEVARLVLGGKVPDPTGGATKFYDAGSGQPGALSLSAVTDRWGAEGFKRYQIPGVSSYFFKRARREALVS